MPLVNHGLFRHERFYGVRPFKNSLLSMFELDDSSNQPGIGWNRGWMKRSQKLLVFHLVGWQNRRSYCIGIRTLNALYFVDTGYR